MNINNYYQTTCFLTASTLLTLGFTIDSLDTSNPSRVVFIFQKTPELEKSIEAFWGNQIQVNPKVFFAVQKELKTRLNQAIRG